MKKILYYVLFDGVRYIFTFMLFAWVAYILLCAILATFGIHVDLYRYFAYNKE